MAEIKIIKQDATTRIFTLSNGDNVPFDNIKQYMKNKESDKKTVQTSDKKKHKKKKEYASDDNN